MKVIHFLCLVTSQMLSCSLAVTEEEVPQCVSLKDSLHCQSNHWEDLSCWFEETNVCKDVQTMDMKANHHLMTRQNESIKFLSHKTTFLQCERDIILEFKCDACSFVKHVNGFAITVPKLSVIASPSAKSVTLSISRDFSYRCYSTSVPLNFFIRINDAGDEQLFSKRTANDDELLVGSLLSNKHYNVSIRACPDFNATSELLHCSETMKTSFKTHKDVPEAPQSFEQSYEILTSSDNQHNVRLHWQSVPQDQRNGDNVSFVIRSDDGWEIETEDCYVDILSVPATQQTFQVFSKNEVGLSMTSLSIAIVEQEADSSSEMMILDKEESSSVLWRSSSPSVTLSWCEESRTRACDHDFQWSQHNSSVGDINSVDLPRHVNFAFLSAPGSSMQYIHCRTAVTEPHSTSLRMLNSSMDSLTFRLDLDVCAGDQDVSRLLLSNFSVTLCSLQTRDDCSTMFSGDHDIVTLTQLSPGTCYSTSHHVSLLWSVSTQPVSTPVYCTSPDHAPTIVTAVQFPTVTDLAITLSTMDNDTELWLYPCHYQLDTGTIVTTDTCDHVTVLPLMSPCASSHCPRVRVRMGESPWSAWHPVMSPPEPPTITHVTATLGTNNSLMVYYIAPPAHGCELSLDGDIRAIPGQQCPGDELCCPPIQSSVTLETPLAPCSQYQLSIRCSNFVLIHPTTLNTLQQQLEMTGSNLTLASEWSQEWQHDSMCPSHGHGTIVAAALASVILTIFLVIGCFFFIRHFNKVRKRFRGLSDMDVMIFPMQTSRDSEFRQHGDKSTMNNDEDDDKYPEMSQQYSNGSVVSDYESFFPLPRQNSTRVRTITQGTASTVYTQITDLPD